MSSNFPSTLTTYTNPAATDKLNSPSHSGIETNQNSGLKQVEAVIGVEGSSSVVGTLQYLIKSPASDGGGHIQTANRGGTGQTAYSKGDLLIASSASVISKLAVGSDGAILTADSTQSSGIKWGTAGATPTAKTLVPFPVLPPDPGQANVGAFTTLSGTVTSMLVGQVTIPFQIVANRLTTAGDSPTENGTLDITMYQESGASSVFTITTSQFGAASQSMVTALSSVTIAAGVYYVGVNANSTSTSVRAVLWRVDPFDPIDVYGLNDSRQKAVINGTYAIASGTPPASIITSSIASDVPLKVVMFRLDN